MGQVGDGRRGDIAPPAILDGHADPQRHAQVAGLASPGEAAEFADLDVHYIGSGVGVGPEQDGNSVDRLVEDEGVAGTPADRQALLVAQAGLLEVDVESGYGTNDARRLVHQPAGVGVGDELVAGLEDGRNGAYPVDIGVGVASHLELEASVALLSVAGHLRRHRLRRLLGDGAVEREIIAVAPPQQDTDRPPRHLTQDVPAGHVDARLDIRMSLQCGVHMAVQLL